MAGLGLGNASYLQLPALQGLQLRWGFQAVTWGGATPYVITTISLSFNAFYGIAAFYDASALTDGYCYLQVVTAGSPGSFQVVCKAQNGTPGAGRIDGFYWVALVS